MIGCWLPWHCATRGSCTETTEMELHTNIQRQHVITTVCSDSLELKLEGKGQRSGGQEVRGQRSGGQRSGGQRSGGQRSVSYPGWWSCCPCWIRPRTPRRCRPTAACWTLSGSTEVQPWQQAPPPRPGAPCQAPPPAPGLDQSHRTSGSSLNTDKFFLLVVLKQILVPEMSVVLNQLVGPLIRS